MFHTFRSRISLWLQSALVVASLSFVSCQPQRQDIIILFDNDVHCATDCYSRMATLHDSLLLSTPFLSVVSAGDFVQGAAIGAISRGEHIVQILNQVPYDVVTLGNHEFDYGVPQLQHLAELLEAEVVACNFSTIDGKDLFAPFTIRQYGPVSVAFIGVMTPTTYTTSTPTFFKDSTGQVIYDFHTNDTYFLIQQTVDQVRQEGADYVVVLSHLGDEPAIATSTQMIQSTCGIDVVIDGHSHHFLDTLCTNLHHDSVYLLSTGARGERIGQLTIGKDGQLSHCFHICKDIPASPRIQTVLDQVQTQLEQEVNRVVGYSECVLSDVDSNGQRMVRNQETALADFTADALRAVLGTQIGVIHGGSLRASLPQGPITIGHIMTALPFGNYAAKVSMTGQQLLDALEVTVAKYPEESGDFHICSGLRYTINPSIPSSVQFDSTGLFIGVGDTRRIVSMDVYDDHSHTWSPIQPLATYTVGGLDYGLLNQGVSGAYRYATPMPCDIMKDTELLTRYIAMLGDTIRANTYSGDLVSPRFSVRY